MVISRYFVVLVMVAAGVLPGFAQQTAPQVEVSGTASINVVPDRITLVTVADVGNYFDRRFSDKFRMAKRLSAVLTDFSQLDKIAENLPENGVTSFSITKLDNSDMARYNREGLKAALDAARSKAEFIAENEGLSGLSVLKVEETSPGYAVPQAFSNIAYSGGSGMENMRRIERQYSVKVTYLFRK